jgi:hypothetical protein
MRFQLRRAVPLGPLGVVATLAIGAAVPLAGLRAGNRAEANESVVSDAAAATAEPTFASARRPGLTVLSPPQSAALRYEFYFTRAVYSGGGRSSFGFYGRGRSQWATDYPKADRQFMVVLNRLIDIDNSPDENAIRLDDPNVRRFPILYALEVGSMGLTEAEVVGLRSYLEAGGFLVIDDFWGPYEWAVFEREITRVLPGRPIYEIPKSHPFFNMVYDVAEVVQVPNVTNGQMHGRYGTPTNEGPGSEVPHVYGIDDDDGRLMVLIYWNTDVGDAWEWAEDPYYPLKFSTYAFEVGVNMIVYGMSH